MSRKQFLGICSENKRTYRIQISLKLIRCEGIGNFRLAFWLDSLERLFLEEKGKRKEERGKRKEEGGKEERERIHILSFRCISFSHSHIPTFSHSHINTSTHHHINKSSHYFIRLLKNLCRFAIQNRNGN